MTMELKIVSFNIIIILCLYFPSFCDRQRYLTKLSIEAESNPQGWIGKNLQIWIYFDNIENQKLDNKTCFEGELKC